MTIAVTFLLFYYMLQTSYITLMNRHFVRVLDWAVTD